MKLYLGTGALLAGFLALAWLRQCHAPGYQPFPIFFSHPRACWVLAARWSSSGSGRSSAQVRWWRRGASGPDDEIDSLVARRRRPPGAFQPAQGA